MTLHFVSMTLYTLSMYWVKAQREETANLVVSRRLFFLIFLFKTLFFLTIFPFFRTFPKHFCANKSFFYILLYSRMCTTYTVSSSHRVCQSSRLPIRCLSIDRNEPQPRLGVFLFFYLDFFYSVRLRNAPQWVFFYSVHFFSFHTFAIRPSVLTSARNEWIYGWDRGTPDWLVR